MAVLKYHNGSAWVPVSYPNASDSQAGVVKLYSDFSTTPSSGMALDATLGKELQNQINNLCGFDYNGTVYNNRLIIKVNEVTIPHNSNYAVTYSTPFPHACLWVGAMPYQSGYGGQCTIHIVTMAANQSFLWMQSSASASLKTKVISIGY